MSHHQLSSDDIINDSFEELWSIFFIKHLSLSPCWEQTSYKMDCSIITIQIQGFSKEQVKFDSFSYKELTTTNATVIHVYIPYKKYVRTPAERHSLHGDTSNIHYTLLKKKYTIIRGAGPRRSQNTSGETCLS